MTIKLKTYLTITATSIFMAGAGLAVAQQAETPETEVEIIQSEDIAVSSSADEAIKIDASSETVKAETTDAATEAETTDMIEEIEPAAEASDLTDDSTETDVEAESSADEVDGPDLP